jgi:hypothetical protein
MVRTATCLWVLDTDQRCAHDLSPHSVTSKTSTDYLRSDSGSSQALPDSEPVQVTLWIDGPWATWRRSRVLGRAIMPVIAFKLPVRDASVVIWVREAIQQLQISNLYTLTFFKHIISHTEYNYSIGCGVDDLRQRSCHTSVYVERCTSKRTQPVKIR